MSRRRDVRRFGRGPYVLSLRRDPGWWGEGFPFDLPAVADVKRLRLGASSTLQIASCARRWRTGA